MSEPEGELDHRIQRLLRETYEQVRPSPEFRQQAYQELVQVLRIRQHPVGWRQRIRVRFEGLVAPERLWRRPAIAVLVAVALLLLLVGSVVRAKPWILNNILGRETVPEVQEPATFPTPTAEPLATSTFVVTVARHADTPTVASSATPVEVEPPAATPSPKVVVTIVPTATRSPTKIATPSPTSSASLTPTKILVPVEVTPSPTEVQVEVTSTATPTTTPCGVGRIVAVAWEDANGNGSRDGGELPLSGVSLALVNVETGEFVRSGSTGGDGQYRFDNVSAGTYELRATPPAGYRATTRDAWGIHLNCATVTIHFGFQP